MDNSSSTQSSRSGMDGPDFLRHHIPTPQRRFVDSDSNGHSQQHSFLHQPMVMTPEMAPSTSSQRGSLRGSISKQASYPTVEVMTGTQTQSDSRNASDAQMMCEGGEQEVIFNDWTSVQPPLVVNKPSLHNVVFKQPVSIRYLKPPTPPPPGPIVIRERRPAPPPPLPPRVIRQQLPKIRTPEPLVIRERPPTPPRPVKPVIIEKHLPAPPPPPQQVIIERYNMPRRPRKVVFEKWLDYKPMKRKIILQKAPNPPPRPPPRNIIIEYSSPVAVSLPEYKIEGVFVADPLTYTYSPYQGELKVVDKIYDLPPPPLGQTKGMAR